MTASMQSTTEIEQILRDEDHESPSPIGSFHDRCSTLTFSFDEPGRVAADGTADRMLAEVDRRFASTYSNARDGCGWRIFDVNGKQYRIDVIFETQEAKVRLITKHGDQEFAGIDSFIHLIDLLDARQTQADRDRVPYVPPAGGEWGDEEERVVHPAEALVESMKAFVEGNYQFEYEWDGQRHGQEDGYSDGVMTSYRMVTLPNIGETLFKFVENGASSCCIVCLNEPVFIYTMDQLTAVIDAVSDPSYAVGRPGIPNAMMVSAEPDDQCPVCLAEADDDVGDWISLSLCFHRFHRSCISKWPCTTCPMCRADHAA